MAPRSHHLREATSGFLASLGVAFAAGVYGLALGAIAAERGIGPGILALQNLLIFAGASQFALVEEWVAPLSAVPLILAVGAINARYLLMTAALRPLFRSDAPLTALPFLHLVADENWAVTIARLRRDELTGPWFLLGGGVAMIAFWMIGTLAGNLVGSAIAEPQRFGLDVVFAAVFCALLASSWRGRRDVPPAVVAAGTALVVERVLPGTWYILAGGIAGSLAAALSPSERGQVGRVS